MKFRFAFSMAVVAIAFLAAPGCSNSTDDAQKAVVEDLNIEMDAGTPGGSTSENADK